MRKVEEMDETIAITKNGVPVGILINIERFEGLMEAIDILSDKETMKSLARASIQQKAGKFFTHEDVWGE